MNPEPDSPRRGRRAGQPPRRLRRPGAGRRGDGAGGRRRVRVGPRPRGHDADRVPEMARSVAEKLAHMEDTRLAADATYEQQDEILADLLEEVVRNGEAAVERARQLEVLRESGVVDAGAYGSLGVIFAGIVAGLRGDIEPPRSRTTSRRDAGRPTPTAATRSAPTSSSPEAGSTARRSCRPGGAQQLGPGGRRRGDDQGPRPHRRPEAAMALFNGQGEVSQLDVADMREQMAERGATTAAAPSSRWSRATASGASTRSSAPSSSTAAKPQPLDLRPAGRALHEVPSEEVVVLPNNPNVPMADEARRRAVGQAPRVHALHLAAGGCWR